MKYGQPVDRAAAAVSRALGDVAQLEETRLVDLRIELRFHLGVGDVARPTREVRDRALRPVAVVRLEPEREGAKVGLDSGQCLGHRAGEWIFERHHSMFLRERMGTDLEYHR